MQEDVARTDDRHSIEDLEALRNHHQELKSRLATLESRLSLTMQEQTERARLKKEKLAVKDRIQVLLARVPLG